MNKLAELPERDEKAIVTRILVHLHRSLDAKFPTVTARPSQFRKTAFHPESSESTVSENAPPSSSSPENQKEAQGFAFSEDTNATVQMYRFRKRIIFLIAALTLGVVGALLYYFFGEFISTLVYY